MPSPLHRTAHVAAAFLALAAGPRALGAQTTGEISGRVTYAATGRGIGQALVVLAGAGLGSFTDADGRFRIVGVPAGLHEVAPTLIGCHLASRTVELGAGEHLEVSFDLSTPVINLQGIVVTAIAVGTPETELPFAVGKLDPAAGDAAGGRSLGTLIQGRVAGARVLFGSGQPGAEPSIQLRGPRSIQGSQEPLVVVDGIITHGIGEIDPMDVEHVEVLKGAAAAAGYGARGHAGVIEIRTRRGPGPSARAGGVLVVVDGVATGATLADLDPTQIEDIRKLDGPAAAVLYGPRAERGVILVSTRGAPPEASRPPFCVVPNWIR